MIHRSYAILLVTFGIGCTAGDGANPCANAANGTSCGDPIENRICLNRKCLASVCGDGFVDGILEQCDDYNHSSHDGCNYPECEWTCESDADCADAEVCNGSETCFLALHRCQSAQNAADGTECTTLGEENVSGVCDDDIGECVPLTCGDSAIDAGESCDDGRNGDPDDGCTDACQFSCVENADCGELSCTGTDQNHIEGRICDTESHVCVDVPETPCDDSDPCTDNLCEPVVGCYFPMIDGDFDSFSPDANGCGGGDCNDSRNDIYPDAPEQCDDEGIDHDCDGRSDDIIDSVVCHIDNDGDGYYAAEGQTIAGCECPDGTIPPPSSGVFDCHDDNEDVRPSQTTYFNSPYVEQGTDDETSFDYNCDGTEEPLWNDDYVFDGCTMNLGMVPLLTDTACSGDGWSEGPAPDCGDGAHWSECSNESGVCLDSERERKQRCL